MGSTGERRWSSTPAMHWRRGSKWNLSRLPRKKGKEADMWSATRYMRDLALAFLALAIIPSTAPAQTTSYSQRLAGLQQRNAFQQQQAAVQAAVQQTTALTQSAFRQGTYRPNGLPLPVVQPLPLNFLLQQAALENALQQTRALQQASLQRNPTLSRLA